MSSWRTAGLNYVNYSNIAARTLRRCIKGAKKEDIRRTKSAIKYFYWVNGEMMEHGKKPEVEKEKVAAAT